MTDKKHTLQIEISEEAFIRLHDFIEQADLSLLPFALTEASAIELALFLLENVNIPAYRSLDTATVAMMSIIEWRIKSRKDMQP